MLKMRWLLALPLICALPLGSAGAATIRDTAGMFDTNAVRDAQTRLDRIESRYQLPVTIETVDSLEGRNIDAVLTEHARERRAEGLYMLIAKGDKKFDIESSGAYARAFPRERLERIRQAMRLEFNKRDFNGGLLAAVNAIDTEGRAAQAEFGSVKQSGANHKANVPLRQRGRPVAGQGTFGIGTLLGIGLFIVAVLIGIRLLGALFSGGAGYGGPGRMGGPGYGGGGYGGGGGFFSGLLGGLGGALAGNWLYDQFSGRHHHGDYVDQSAYGSSEADSSSQPDNDNWGGGSGGTSWDDSGGGDAGGGDWGGGGGGDWGGGGGGDWGGGGGDDGGGW